MTCWSPAVAEPFQPGATAGRRSGERRPYLFLVLHREEGQGLAEYALILSLIALLAIGALFFMSGQLDHLLSMIGSKV